MAGGVRAQRREQVTSAILVAGRRHLTEHGAASLSLRAVARDVGVVSSAVYRYVTDRDALLTLLVVDAYTELGSAVDAAVAAAADRAWDERVVVAAATFRAWAVAEPARYALLYGSPVPGYAAPPAETLEPGTRVVRALVALVAEGVAAGEVVSESAGPVAHDTAVRRRTVAELSAVAEDLGLGNRPEVIARAVHLWASVVGSVSLEVFGQFGEGTFTEPGVLHEHGTRLALASLRSEHSAAATPAADGRLPVARRSRAAGRGVSGRTAQP
ncbi:MAG TPA: TetR/AcrR family transcriptional regulator [Dermatophilaceae bacterium]|nr:TetR/AcrR family transcriptional regulator [Dermatophilaceae bacterium]